MSTLNLFPLPLGVWEGLWPVIVALPGLFSYILNFYFIEDQKDIPTLFTFS